MSQNVCQYCGQYHQPSSECRAIESPASSGTACSACGGNGYMVQGGEGPDMKCSMHVRCWKCWGKGAVSASPAAPQLLTAEMVAQKLANVSGIDRWAKILDEWMNSYIARWKEEEAVRVASPAASTTRTYQQADCPKCHQRITVEVLGLRGATQGDAPAQRPILQEVELAERYIHAAIKHSGATSVVRSLSKEQIHAAASYCACFSQDRNRPDFIAMIEYKEAVGSGEGSKS